ncbi:hopanoid-associated sugar epimerase [Methylocystis sp. ATCC 49242]|uniref:hopanoid-associated sugar epimerase n=1 Tax=Methylocystis sp. ATCC 49242 TaxID=622637 RepID=UPI0001F86A45|nr:hopanoid-associated sugar epimerase [Methylocystis sp. ATCC 49242]
MNPNDRALVTGASGFIGGAVVRLLLRKGYRVRVLVRPRSRRDNIPPECEIIEGDITDRDSVRRAMADVRFLFHLAANYRLWAPDPTPVMRVNVGGTETVMREALRSGVERIVHTSSVATLAPDNDGVCTEVSRLPPEKAIGAYKRSKILSERIVEELIEKEGLPAVIVCPSAPLGPGDLRPTPTGRIVSEALRGGMPAYVETGLNIVHVDDVAAGQFAALERGVIGERYILGGENLTLRDLLTEISRITGRPGPRFRVPYAPLIPLAYANEWAARLTGSEPFLNRESLRLSETRMFFDDSKARAELGYETRPAEAAIEDAVRWFRDSGGRKG